MELALALDLVTGAGVGFFSPADLGSSLLGWWDAERTDLITQSGGSVSSWRDVIAGYNAVQATGASKPAYSASSFNSRPGVTFDGTDDNLRVASQPFPSGAAPSEMWALSSQDAPVATTGTRRLLAYGGILLTDARYQARAISTINVASSSTGTGASNTTAASASSLEFLGRHVARSIFTATTIQTDIDGVVGTPAAAISATNATGEVRIGAGTNSAGFFLGVINTLIVTDGQQTAAQTAALYAYLKARGGIA